MTTRYRVIMYERTTDREGGIIDVQPALVPQALNIAGVSNPVEPGEIELADARARALANLLGFRPDVSRYVYHLETLAAGPLRA
jgi:hypothetical protein